ncbi:creatininase family protein [Rubellimicrobium arenae]|uniref:creatininase family protein n=1 Tax=Rubellimicrobium arenae TaxID=2817372 RepID=UPI001B3104E4|nr:creatininase family protein [Rubellimicrobium arenae]
MIFREDVRWETLKPQEFLARQAACPVVYLPMGLCEPHGHVAPFGLDTIKADWLCDEAAHRFGGIVAPTMNYHVHETGYHAPWLEEVMGGVNPRLGALPPQVVFQTLLYQLRAFRNAGFRGLVLISGHHGAQADLRRVVEAFSDAFGMAHFVRTDPELVAGRFTGDHAGRYELSQLLAIRPDLVDLSRAGRVGTDPLGRFAQNPDVEEASADEGTRILGASLDRIGQAVSALDLPDIPADAFLTLSDVDDLWDRFRVTQGDWVTLSAG